MKLQGITSVLAAAVAVGLVVWVGASSEEQIIEAVPAPIAVQSPAVPPPAPGVGQVSEDLADAFGEGFADPLGVYSNAYETWFMPGDEDLPYDPYNAPTPEVTQPDGADQPDSAVVPLPTAPPTIRTETVEAVDTEAGVLLSQPVRGRSTSKFGMRFHPVLRVYKLHTGHDWAASCGTPVGAAAAGTVVGTGWAGGNGVQVKVDHGMLGGYRVVTTYNHLSSIGVKVGQKVAALQGIGRVGNTGYSTGCHLHFEVIVNGQFTDPLPWLNGTPGIVDLSEMMTISPDEPGSPSPTQSVSPSPSVVVSPSITPSNPPPAPTPGETQVAEPTPTPSSTQPGQAGSPPPEAQPEPKPGEPSVPATPTPSSPTTPPLLTAPAISPAPSEPVATEPVSPEPSLSPSPSPSASPSPTPKPEPSPTPPAPTPTGAVSPTPTVVLSSTPSSSPTVTVSAAPSSTTAEVTEPVPTEE